MFTPRAVSALAACASLAVLAGSPSPAAAQAPPPAPFTPAALLTFDPMSRLESVALGDFDSDGKQDLAVADFRGARVHIRLGNGDGSFRDAPPITDLDRPVAIVVGDFGADGNEDLAVVAGTGNDKDVAVLGGRGDGTFSLQTAFAVPGGFARSLAAADFNGDRRTDLVAAASEHVSLRLATENGTFEPGVDEPFNTGASMDPQFVATGDFDGDGNEDVVAALRATSPTENATLRLLPGLGNGGFRPVKRVTLPSPARGLAVGDVNADSRQDVVGTIITRGTVSVKVGAGAGDLADAERPEVVVGEAPRGVALGDFDGDGREDLATANGGDDSVSVRLGDGAGGFVTGGEVPVGVGPIALAAGDFDNDGRADLAVANDMSGTVSILLGAGEAPLAGSLLVNGGLEQGLGGRLPEQAPALPGWTTTGGMTAVRYNAHPAIGFPSWLDAPRYQTGGLNLFWGGINKGDTLSTATQVVDVSGSRRAIDRGLATIALSAWVGGAQAFPDSIVVTAEFRDAGGVRTGFLRLPPGADRRGLTTLVRTGGTATLPAGTRQIAVTLTSIDNDAFSSATADNVKLTLDAPQIDEPDPGPPAPDGGPAGPGGTPDSTGGPSGDRPGGSAADRDAPVIDRLRLSRTRFAVGRRGTRIRYTLSEPAAVSLRIERTRKGRRRATVGTLRRTGRPGANRVAFSGRIGRKALRRGAYRLVITAVDAAGNRSVTRSRKFRIVR